ncbi:MAG: hypothetical protein LBQ38_11300 [Spirochaetaceae bacterium]|jgi:hypothetical protein|nr:hypothetical protein [Spirochaetaceae bacterium]
MSSADWRDVKYHETFKQEVQGLLRRRKADSKCRPEDLEGILRHLYHMDGSDWGGRGEVQDITLAATIAAYEYIITEWKAEKPGN